MVNELATIDDRRYDGRAMRKLSERRRSFVVYLMAEGPVPGAAMTAAEKAGYHPFYGYELMRDDNIIAALHEESGKLLAGAVLPGVKVLLEIAQDPTHKDRFKAAKELAALNGFTPEHKIVVEHVNNDTKEQLERIKVMATQLGIDPKLLLPNIEDGEFSEVG